MKARMKRQFLFGCGLVLLAIALVGVFRATRGRSASDTETAVQVNSGIAVTSAIAQLREMPIGLDGLGTVQPFNSVLVRARVDGQIDKIFFREGQDVKRGDILAQIDAQPFEAQLRQAQAAQAKDDAQLANARLDLARYSDSIHRGAVSAQLLDTARAQTTQLAAQVRADAAAVEAARVQLGYSTIRAPIDGRTGARLIDAGNLVHANDANGIVLINQVQPISVVFTLPAQSLPDIQAHQRAGELDVAALRRDGNQTLATGKLALIDNQIDSSTATIRLKATFANDDVTLWPGQFVNARLILELKKNAITIPSPAVQSGPNGPYVFAIKADRSVALRSVEVAVAADGISTIVQGLAAGEEVVLEGQYKLESGVHVHVVAVQADPK